MGTRGAASPQQHFCSFLVTLFFYPFWNSQSLDEVRVKQGPRESHSPFSTDPLCLHPAPTKPKECCPL